MVESQWRSQMPTPTCPVRKFLPHPIFSVVVAGFRAVFVVYAVFLAYFGLVGLEASRHQIGVWFPGLGEPIVEEDFGDACHLTADNVSNVIWDFYTIAHTIGWFFVAGTCRDLYLCLFLSVWFEYLEWSHCHNLPNFCECWWDIIYDVVLCNPLGIAVGIIAGQTVMGKEKPSALFLLNTAPLGDHLKIFCLFLLSASFTFLNGFYLKNLLWIPSTHPLNVAFRSITPILTLAYYVQQRFRVALTIVAYETLLTLVLARGNYSNPVPEVVMWTFVGLVLAVISAFTAAYVKDNRRKRRKVE